ncbi:MAG: hypothetical protein LBB42_04975 [Coriobacteriales bacterium]|jgi:hypothetical protein|nr:hypothetical protein [Coriobacteriales bacterium]
MSQDPFKAFSRVAGELLGDLVKKGIEKGLESMPVPPDASLPPATSGQPPQTAPAEASNPKEQKLTPREYEKRAMEEIRARNEARRLRKIPPTYEKMPKGEPVFDNAGHPLVYRAHDMEIYATNVEFRARTDSEEAQLRFFYKIVNNSNKHRVVSLTIEKVNDVKRRYVVYEPRFEGIPTRPAWPFDVVSVKRKTILPDESDEYSDRPLRLSITPQYFDLPVVQLGNGKRELDRSVGYEITGTFDIYNRKTKDIASGFESEVDEGFFAISLPANFAENTVRTHEAWLSVPDED